MDPALLDAGVLEPGREVRSPGAAAEDASDPVGKQLEIGVPDPGDVAAVGDLIVEDAQQVVLARLERQGSKYLVGAGGVLDEHDPQLAGCARGVAPLPERSTATATLSARPKAGCVSCRPATICRKGNLERDGQGGRREGVVDVVEARAGPAAPRRSPRGCAA